MPLLGDRANLCELHLLWAIRPTGDSCPSRDVLDMPVGHAKHKCFLGYEATMLFLGWCLCLNSTVL